MMELTESSRQLSRLQQFLVVFSLESLPSSLISSELSDQELVSFSLSPSFTDFTRTSLKKRPLREKPKAVKNDYHIPI